MYQAVIRQDIITSVDRALAARHDQLNEAAMVRRSDSLLATLPGVSGARAATTAMLLRRYHAPLRRELCQGNQPRVGAMAVEDELQELTRAVLVTIGIGEGISIEAAVGMALALHKRGVGPFCALP